VRVVGIDPGLAACGYGVVEADGSKAEALAYGCWQTEAGVRIELRLRELFLALTELLAEHQPDVVVRLRQARNTRPTRRPGKHEHDPDRGAGGRDDDHERLVLKPQGRAAESHPTSRETSPHKTGLPGRDLRGT
jgi:Crossover junction endodeoxyribonuclease RuvC